MGLMDLFQGVSGFNISPQKGGNPYQDMILQAKQQAFLQSMMTLGGGLMEAGRPRPMNQPGPGIGQALMGAAGAYRNSMNQAAQRGLLKMQMDEYGRKQTARANLVRAMGGRPGGEARRLGVAPVPGGITNAAPPGLMALGNPARNPAFMSALMNYDPSAAVGLMTRQPRAPTVRDFTVGNQTQSRQYDPRTGKWNTLSSGPRFKPGSGGGSATALERSSRFLSSALGISLQAAARMVSQSKGESDRSFYGRIYGAAIRNMRPAGEAKRLAEQAVEARREYLGATGFAGGQSRKSAAAAVPPPGKRIAGKTYPTPRGPMRWTGTGWLPAGK